jgi:hypothetical protein
MRHGTPHENGEASAPLAKRRGLSKYSTESSHGRRSPAEQEKARVVHIDENFDFSRISHHFGFGGFQALLT